MITRGICPEGWHMPTKKEWQNLLDYLGGSQIAGGKLKETGTVHWKPPNTAATNETGFKALPGGYVEGTGGQEQKFYGVMKLILQELSGRPQSLPMELRS